MKRVRQYKGILEAAAAYYSVHEGAHLLCAVLLGAFKQIRFMGIGMQIDVYAERMTDGQMALFCVAGASATLFAGIMLAALAGKISRIKSKLLRAVMYYITIAFLLLDPLYLSILCGFFGGGDMNGISLLFPEWAVRIAFAGLLIINGWIFWKRVLPVYKESFSNGIGKQLLNAVKDYSKEKGVAGIVLYTSEYAPAAKFYEKNGFKLSNGTICMYCE